MIAANARIGVMVVARREIVRFLRQPARVAAAIGTPCLLWLLLAGGFADALLGEMIGAVSYTAFLLPGMMTLTAVFAAVFSSITVIDDRKEGWLQAVLVAPVPRWSIAVGKVIGTGLMAWVQAAVLLLALPWLDLSVSLVNVLLMLLALGLTSFAMASLGLTFAWDAESTASFHAVMNLLFVPMWLLSGAFFPTGGASPWMAGLVYLNPLTWCTQAMRSAMLGEPSWLMFLATMVFTALMVVLAVRMVAGRVQRSLSGRG